MRKLLLASLLLLVVLATLSEAQVNYSYQAVNRNIITASQYCSNTNKCNIIGSGAAFHQLAWNVSGTLSACSVRVDSSADGVTWGSGDIIAAQTCTSNGQALSTSHVVNYVRINVVTITPVAAATLTVNLTGYANNPSVGGGGTVTNVATTSPISGGPITTTGTLSCPTCATQVTTFIDQNSGDDLALASGDNNKFYNISNCAFNITLPDPAPTVGWHVQLNDVDLQNGGSDYCTIDPLGARTLNDSGALMPIGPGMAITVYSNGTNYYSNNGYRPLLEINGGPVVANNNTLNVATDSLSRMTVSDFGGGTAYFSVVATNFPTLQQNVSLPAHTGAIGTTTISGATSAGLYLISSSLSCDTAVAGATAALTLTFKDSSNTTQTVGPLTATCTTLGSSSYVAIETPVNLFLNSALTYAVAIANAPTYTLRLAIYKLVI